jgi:hypothetical protein
MSVIGISGFPRYHNEPDGSLSIYIIYLFRVLLYTEYCPIPRREYSVLSKLTRSIHILRDRDTRSVLWKSYMNGATRQRCQVVKRPRPNIRRKIPGFRDRKHSFKLKKEGFLKKATGSPPSRMMKSRPRSASISFLDVLRFTETRRRGCSLLSRRAHAASIPCHRRPRGRRATQLRKREATIAHYDSDLRRAPG